MLAIDTNVSDNIPLGSDFYRLIFKASRIASQAQPGQFIHLNISGSPGILRRPFSIFDSSSPYVEIVYRVVGGVTLKMSALKRGDPLSVMGPIGTGFTLSGSAVPVLVAGGTGLASLHFLKEKIKPGVLFFGAADKLQVWGMRFFKQKGWKVFIATENGSQGRKGLVTESFEQFLRYKKSKEKINVYVCGPMGMIRETIRICRKHRVPGEASLENVMACGVGACQGCVVELTGKKNYKRVCVDGPVFNIKQIKCA